MQTKDRLEDTSRCVHAATSIMDHLIASDSDTLIPTLFDPEFTNTESRQFSNSCTASWGSRYVITYPARSRVRHGAGDLRRNPELTRQHNSMRTRTNECTSVVSDFTILNQENEPGLLLDWGTLRYQPPAVRRQVLRLC